MRDWFRNIDWAAIVGSALALAFMLLVFVPRISPPEGAHEPQYRDCQCEDDYPRVAEPAPPGFIERTITDPVAAFTAALALFSLILTVVSFVQIRFLISADITARRSAIAARKAANAGARTVRTMESTAERQLRAYVWAKAMDLHDLQPGKLPYVVCDIMNAGQTPAYDVQVFGGSLIYQFPLPANTPFPTIRPAQSSRLVLHPGAKPFQGYAFFGRTPLPGLNLEQVRAIQAGTEMRLFVFMLVTYRDAFDKPRETRLCVSVDARDALVPDEKGNLKAKYHVGFEHADQHNTAT